MFSTHRRLSFFLRLYLTNITQENYASDLVVYYTHFEITGGLCNLIGSNWCDLFTNRTIATFVSKTLTFSPKRWMNFQTGSVRYCINKIFELTKSFIWEFQNGCNKVVIEPRVVQFWSEVILVISNRTRAARSFDFEITQMISTQIALHSVQLPLLITKRSNC